MVILDTFSEVNDGDQLNDGYFNSSMVHARSSSEDVSEYSVTTNAWADLGYSKTFTPDYGTNNLIFGLKITLDHKYATAVGQLRGVLTNNTTGASIYLTINSDQSYNGSSSNQANLSLITNTTYATSTFYIGFPNYADAFTTGAGSMSTDEFFKSILSGASYTLTFEAQDDTNGGTATTIFITNITATIYYVVVRDEQVGGWA